MEENGFTVNVVNIDNLAGIKSQYQVPTELQGCHTAIVGGYVFEGHVSVAEINRVLTEKPAILGIAVPGMPPGSPGMGPIGSGGPYDVIAFDETGPLEVYASYPK